jgi:hypothetical protein
MDFSFAPSNSFRDLYRTKHRHRHRIIRQRSSTCGRLVSTFPFSPHYPVLSTLVKLSSFVALQFSLIFWLPFGVAKSLVWQIIVPLPSVSFPFPFVPQDLAPVLLLLPVPLPSPSPFPVRVPLFLPGAAQALPAG